MTMQPVLDAHMHLDPRGTNRTAVRAFLKEGGTHLIIVHKPYDDIPLSYTSDYAKAFDMTERLTLMAREVGAKAWCVIGPYPGELPHLADRFGLGQAIDLQRSALKEAASRVGNGTVIGLGEIGRVHFPVKEEVQAGCDQLLAEAFSMCSELDCCAVLHTESPRDNPGLMSHLACICDEAGLSRSRAVKHYSGGEMADPALNMGLTPSVLATKENLTRALSKKAPFLMETDFIDEPSRPNVVLPPDTVPKKIRWMLSRGLMDEEMHHRLMVDLPASAMGLEVSL